MKDRLITLVGGGGFVGRYVAQALLKTGARVRIAGRDPRDAWFVKPQGGLGQTQFVAVDITRPETLGRAFAGADAVVNLVGILKGDFQAVHVAGARAVAQAVAAAGVTSLVHMSALGADSDSPSTYLSSKADGEAAVRGAFPDAIIVRPSVIFGREDGFVNRFAALVASLPVVPVLRAPAKFQPVYVADVADAILAALADPAQRGATLELGGPDVITMGGLIRWLAKSIGRDPAIVELPDPVGAAIARLGFLPLAPITRDQWLSLQVDSVVQGENGLARLGIASTPMASIVPAWLVRYRRHGRFGAKVAA